MAIPSTMSKQISEAEDLELSYRVLHPSAILHDDMTNSNIKIPFSSLTNKYKDFLSKIIITIDLTDEMELKYRYKPKAVSQDLYNTTEFWNDILILNNCFSTYQFTPKKLKIYDPENLKKYLNEILILEKIIV